MIPSRQANFTDESTYQQWVQTEGIPIIREFFIQDIKKVALEPWERMGGLGVYLNLIGTGEANDAYIYEIPPGQKGKEQHHLFEEMIYVISGHGATSIWQANGKKQSFEWQTGSLFSPPINCHYQHFNGSGSEPARMLAVTNAPVLLNLFHNADFVFNNGYVFSDRFSGEEEYFSGKGHSFPGRIWDTNFVPDVHTMALQSWKERGAGGKNIMLELSENTMGAHISEFPVGTYKKAHRHGPGAHVIIIAGKGYSCLWPQGEEIKRFDWQPGAIVVPPDFWFHQHFNAGNEPARYLALRASGRKFKGLRKLYGVDEDVKKGGSQMEYEDEDPRIHREFEEQLVKVGARCAMGGLHPGCTAKAAA
jgi:quercetin dioxygenase-like cupin family protein